MRHKKELMWIGGSVLVLALLLSLGEVMTGDGAGPARHLSSATMGMDMAYGDDEEMAMMEKGMAADMAVGAPSAMMVRTESYGGGGFIPPSPEPTAGESAAEVEQRIIKNGSLNLEVEDVADSILRVTGLAKTYGGFVQHSSVSERGDGTFAGNITIRMPSEEFEKSLSDVKSLATLVKYESVSGQDVTEQFTDMQARLRNAEAQEETYLDILDKATSVEDILKVQRELGNIRAQIESYTGRLKYLENQTSLSTLHINLEEKLVVSAPTKNFRPGTAVSAALQAVVQVFQGFVVWIIWLAIIGVGVLVPLILLMWLIVWVIKRIIVKKLGGGDRRR